MTLKVPMTLVALAALVAVAGAADAAPRLVNAIVASVDGAPITLREFESFKKRRAPLLTPDQRENEDTLLDALVMNRIFEAEFEAQGIRAPDAEVEAYIDQVIPRAGSSREQIMSTLNELGLEWSDYFERMREEVQRFELINREIRSRVNVTPEEIRSHWKNDPAYELPERVECAHIFIPFPREADEAAITAVRELGAEAYKEARRGGSAFAKAAKKYSRAPSAAAGGYLGAFRRGSMSRLYERMLSALDPGEVSEPGEDASGVHIVQLIDVLPPERVPLSDVEDEIRDKLYDELLQERFTRWVREDVRGRHHVTRHLSELQSLTAE